MDHISYSKTACFYVVVLETIGINSSTLQCVIINRTPESAREHSTVQLSFLFTLNNQCLKRMISPEHSSLVVESLYGNTDTEGARMKMANNPQILSSPPRKLLENILFKFNCFFILDEKTV